MTDADKPFADWIGRETEAEDLITERLVDSFGAIFQPCLADVAVGEVPLGIHWCLSPAIEPMTALGHDGHPAKNLSLPPVPLPRRMWAGGTLELVDGLRLGDRVQRRSTIAEVVRKIGKTGELWFVAVDHEYRTDRGVAIRERHDIVYREAAGSTSGRSAADRGEPPRPVGVPWTVETSPTLLFRYSAITFNGHRIHYDLPYATQVEGYSGLVVHGPLQATLLLNLAASGNSRPVRFEYRGVAPAIAGAPLRVCAGANDELWTAGPDGAVYMQARATR